LSGNFCQVLEPVEAMDVSYSGTSPTGRLPSSIRFSTNLPETLSMTITAAHVPAIVALLAGVLILIMPRFLNFIVAIYLILVGLHGLGFLRMFHM
jgi:ABC-type bacteriocin/lantibiotic exporter with double-glycine peptidase domain